MSHLRLVSEFFQRRRRRNHVLGLVGEKRNTACC
jgi:hypothetical protein